MKKLLLAVALLATNAFAADLTIINPGAKTSPTTVFSMSLKQAVGANFYQASDCVDAYNKYAKTPDAIFVYNSSIEFGAINIGLSCPLKGVTAEQTAFVGKTYMWVCRKPGSTADVNGKGQSLGMASMYATKRHEADFNAHGADIKIVPYSGSKDIVNAVRAGDVTLGWIGSGMAKKQVDAGTLECLYSTDPDAPNYLGKKIAVTVPYFNIAYVVMTNSKDPAVLAKLRAVGVNEEFQKYMKSSLTFGTWNPAQSDIDAVIKYVDTLSKTWVDKK